MELNFFFRGIELGDNGTFPRAIVDVVQDESTLSADMAYAKIRITLPLRSLDINAAATGRDALQTARQLLNGPALAAWLQAQTGLPETPAAG